MRARLPLLLALAGLILVVGFGVQTRVSLTLKDPNFDRESAEGLLRSDPALLYYFVQRLVDHGGWPPGDWDRDPRVEHPHRVDLQEDFTIAQEYLAAWSYLAHRGLGGEMPLHMWCLYVFAITASLSAVGVFGLTLELTRKPPWALFAALLYALLPANYRTIGFLLIREDFALPWLSLHLWALARAVRVQTPAAFVLAALPAVLALASWHAMRFVVSIECGCFLLSYLVSGHNPFQRRGAWWGLGALAVFSLFVPVLRSKWFLVSLPLQILGALAVAWAVERRRPLARAVLRAPLALGALALLFGGSKLLSVLTGAGFADYSHVFALLVGKLKHLGEYPADPSVLPFGARLLWQGPFDTADPARMWRELAPGLCALGLAPVFLVLRWRVLAGKGPATPLRRWMARRPAGDLFVLVVAALSCTVLAYWIVRNVVLCGLILPVLTARLLSMIGPGPTEPLAGGARPAAPRSIAPWLGLAAAALTAVPYAGIVWPKFREYHRISWYADPGQSGLPPDRRGPNRYQAEIATLVRWLSEHREVVPADAAVCADMVTSTAVLAWDGNPIVVQPKYETAEARRRVQDFLEAVVLGTPDDVRRMMGRYDCRFLLIDRFSVLGQKAIVGLADDAPPPARSAIRRFASTESAILQGIPGFRLVYRSPAQLYDLYRLYEVEPLPAGN